MKIHVLKLADPKYRDNPWREFGTLRESGEIIRIKMPFLGKSWAVTSYDAVNDVLKNSEDFVRDPKNAGRKNFIPMQWILPRSFYSVVNNMLGADGQKHRRLRLLVDRAFALRNIDAMSEQIEEIVTEQLQHFDAKLKTDGQADLMEHFARPFPLTVICELLGLPLEDRPKFKQWFAPFSTVRSIFGIYKFGTGIHRIVKYLKQQFEDVRNSPGFGLISDLVQLEMEGERLSEDELVSMVFLLLVAGHETTVHLISNLVLSLLQNQKPRQELLGDWELMDGAIEETLRYSTPIQFAKPRYVARDIEYLGVELKRGEMVVPLLACANYDPVRFDKPTEFIIQREKNYHMTFGSGPHVCLGMKLARAETKHAIQKLFDAYPDLQPAFDLRKPDWSKRIGVRGLNSLLLTAN